MEDIRSYRFNISFRGVDEDTVRVGELLKQLGHKKSAVIVTAVSEYLDRHPERLGAVSADAQLNKRVLEAMIEQVVAAKLSEMSLFAGDKFGTPFASVPELTEDKKTKLTENVSASVMEMADNLGMFG